MSGLTPSERRGAIVLAIVLVIGTLTDLYRARHPRRAPILAPAPATAGEAGVSAAESAGAAPRPPTGRLDLDQATASDLDRLPGIGPVLAARIVEYRRLHGRFRSVDELLSVPGIGPRLLERLRPYLRAPGR